MENTKGKQIINKLNWMQFEISTDRPTRLNKTYGVVVSICRHGGESQI